MASDEFVQLRELAAEYNLPIIGLGYLSSDVSRDYLDSLGIQYVLDDPIRPSSLFDALAEVLSVRKEVVPIQPPLSPLPESQLSGHVLVAEDNRINQLYLVELIKYFGCTVDLAVNGEEALAAIQKQRYDMVFMDCQMPEMDGFTAAEEIRKLEAAGELPGESPSWLTANALKGDRERCLAAGMDDYISKPFEGPQLKAVMARYLGRISS